MPEDPLHPRDKNRGVDDCGSTDNVPDMRALGK